MSRIYERRQVAAGLGGMHWQERVSEQDGRLKVPDGASKLEDDAEAYDWRPMAPQPDDAGVLPEGGEPAPVPKVPLADGVVTPPEVVH